MSSPRPCRSLRRAAGGEFSSHILSPNRCQRPYSPGVAIVPGSLSSPDREPASVSCAAASDGDAAGGGVNFGRWNWTEMAVLADGQLTFGPRDAPGGPGGQLIGRVLPFRRGDFAGSACGSMGSLSRQPMASTRRSRRTLIPGSGTPRMGRAPSFRFGLKRSRNRMNC